jgi:hypothetical protein
MKDYKSVLNNSVMLNKFLFPVVCMLLLIGIVGSANAEKNRFSPPSFNSGLDNFNKRFSSNSVNIEFIVAQVLNNARQIDRAGEDFKNNASLYRNHSTGGANAGSVIIPPGTTADTIIIINQNDGDSYAIQR